MILKLTLTYFTTMSNLVKFVLYMYLYIRPRYQVSVYRTIGNLWFCFVVAIFDLEHDVEAIHGLF